MDTASHFLIGLGLGGMAQAITQASDQPNVGAALIISAVVASEAPDFDYIYMLKGHPAYLKKHRGITHSIPFWFVWPSLITCAWLLFDPGLPGSVIWFWSFIAVIVHVGLDALNTFGTQPLLPFSDRRISLDVLTVMDPGLFIIQLIGILLWWMDVFPAGPLLALTEAAAAFYIFLRIAIRKNVMRRLSNFFKEEQLVRLNLTPTYRLTCWGAAVESTQWVWLGRIWANGQAEADRLLVKPKKEEMPDWRRFMRQSPVLDSFFYIAQCFYSESKREGDHVLYTLTDFRFRSGRTFPFRVAIQVDQEGRVIQENFGIRSSK